MKATEMKPATARIAEINPAAIDRYKEMRSTLLKMPGVDPTMCEIMVATQLALLGHEIPFKIHSMRALALNVSKEHLQGFILAGLGVTFIACEAARALAWLDEAYEEFTVSA